MSEPPSMLGIIADLVRDPNANPENVRALIEMERAARGEAERISFERSMSAAQSEMAPVVRDAQNEHTRSRYAKLEKIDHIIRPIYTRHGFSLSFDQPSETEGSVVVVCTVGHEHGFSKSYRLAGAPDAVGAKGNTNKTPIQAIGSTITYLRRYLTCMIFNVALTDDDNDGNPVQPISAHQWRELADLIAETDTDMAKFLKFMGIGDLADMSATDFPKAKGALLKKRAEMANAAASTADAAEKEGAPA